MNGFSLADFTSAFDHFAKALLADWAITEDMAPEERVAAEWWNRQPKDKRDLERIVAFLNNPTRTDLLD